MVTSVFHLAKISWKVDREGRILFGKKCWLSDCCNMKCSSLNMRKTEKQLAFLVFLITIWLLEDSVEMAPTFFKWITDHHFLELWLRFLLLKYLVKCIYFGYLKNLVRRKEYLARSSSHAHPWWASCMHFNISCGVVSGIKLVIIAQIHSGNVWFTAYLQIFCSL